MKVKAASIITLITVMSLWGTTLSNSLTAQESSSDVLRNEIELNRSAIQNERQSIIALAMRLTEDESKNFPGVNYPLMRGGV